ncbi:RNase adapter RapZ [Peptoniphilus sp.]|jgi:UPF0042 nucleotide-binding protein|uniref:RNase adapter RapZ n=1 Tax=Peptoniphilus sp. TaxID=1971214 RepID=UPI003D8B5931
MDLIIITGMSGSGKSFALDVFEDLGYYSVDNLAPALLPKFCEMALDAKSNNFDKVAAVIDLRSGEFFDNFFQALDSLKEMQVNIKIIFMFADQKTIISRYKELRRPHPLNRSIVDGYNYEEKTLAKIKETADFVIDTTDLSTANLRTQLLALVSYEPKDKFTIEITSFGYKDGILQDADLVFDVRFLPNPYYIKELRDYDGTTDIVRDYVLKWDVTKEFINKIVDLLKFLIPHYINEQKRMLSIGFGCTGGYHRSVAIAEEIGKILKEEYNSCYVTHRDMRKKLWTKR